MLNSWHAARTGKMPQPTPLQQQSIQKGQQNAQLSIINTQSNDIDDDNAMVHSHPSSVPPLSVSASEWANVPHSLTVLLQTLVNRDADHTKNIHTLKLACEELKRNLKETVTHAAVSQLTVGTASLQREFAQFKADRAKEKAMQDERAHQMENTIARQAAEIATLTRRVAHHESSSGVSLDSLSNNLSHAQRDIKERGLIMAKLADRLMDEVDGQRVALHMLEGKIKEMERRVYLFEYTNNPNASKALVPANVQGNPFSNSQALNARKQANFVTHEAIQALPPGSAVFNAAGQAALSAALKSDTLNPHPLSDVIEQHQHQLQQPYIQQGQETPPQQQPQLTSAQSSPARESSPSVLTPTQQPSAAVVEAVTPHRPPPPPHAFQPEPSSLLSRDGNMTLPLPPGEMGAHNKSQFQRYLADYTTRNLQRDLLEIAETYQSTIRNEVDGLRAQLITLRRQHSEELNKQSTSIDSFVKSALSNQQEQKRSISALELFLKGKTSELMERMILVENKCAQIDGLSSARGGQLELKYQQRNEEIVVALESLERRLEDATGGRVMRPPTGTNSGTVSNSAAEAALLTGLEKDVRVLNVNLEQTVKIHNGRFSSHQQEFTKLHNSIDTLRRDSMQAIASLHGQMKSLFADAFAAVHQDLLPSLTHSSVGAHGQPGVGGEKARFMLRSRGKQLSPRIQTPRQGQTHLEHDSRELGSGEEKQIPSSASDDGQRVSSRGYSTAGQVKRRPIAVSGLSRGHGSTAATTPNGQIPLMYNEFPHPPDASHSKSHTPRHAQSAAAASPSFQHATTIEQVLHVARNELQVRPPSGGSYVRSNHELSGFEPN